MSFALLNSEITMTKYNTENLKPFKPGKSGNPKGRPKKVIAQLEKLVGQKFGLQLSKADKYQLIEWCLERTPTELRAVAEDPKSPIFIVNIASAVIKDTKAGRINTVEAIFDRVFSTGQKGTGPSQVVLIKVEYDK